MLDTLTDDSGDFPANDHNARNSSPDAERAYQAARDAVHKLMGSFEAWLALGRGVEFARKEAAETGVYGEDTFMQILEREDLARALGRKPATIRSNASRLETILKHLPEIEAWRATLDDEKKLNWASPASVLKRCPIFDAHKQQNDGERDPNSASETVRELKKHNTRLQQEAAIADTMVEALYGDLFETGEPEAISTFLLESIRDSDRLRLACLAVLAKLGYAMKDPAAPKPKRKRKSGAQGRKERAAREAAQVAASAT